MALHEVSLLGSTLLSLNRNRDPSVPGEILVGWNTRAQVAPWNGVSHEPFVGRSTLQVACYGRRHIFQYSGTLPAMRSMTPISASKFGSHSAAQAGRTSPQAISEELPVKKYP